MRILAIAIVLLGLVPVASAEMIEKGGRFGGLDVTYKVVLPNGYDAARSYPVILVFTGGSQQLRGAESTLSSDWQAEAERRGYIVISPGSPDGSLFFEAGDRIFPDFLEMIRRDYRVPLGAMHVAGHSNGGLSAFHIAAKYPAFFKTVTGYPGLLDGENLGRIQRLKPMCLFMHVGEQDPSWMAAMVRQAETLQQQGFSIKYAVEKNQVHRLRAQDINLSKRLFDQIEGCKR